MNPVGHAKVLPPVASWQILKMKISAAVAPDTVELLTFPVGFDADLFGNLVVVAQDFLRRLADGGPFARDEARVEAIVRI